VNARPGDAIASLGHGGAFLLPRGGGAREISLRPPKGPFERSYATLSESELLDRDARLRRLPDGPEPAAVAAARAAGPRRLPDQHPPLVEVEPSPEMEEFRAMTAGVAAAAEAAGFEVRFADHSESPVVRLRVYAGDTVDFAGRKEFMSSFYVGWAYIPRFLEVEAPAEAPVPGAEPASTDAFKGRVTLKYRLQPGDLPAVQQAVEALASARAAPAPPGP
jgi:hypothetical protein